MSDFSDAYFSKLRSAIEPQPKQTDRDVSNRALQLGDQYQPRTEIIDPAGTFVACDEWVQCISLQPQQATGLVRLLAEGGGFTVGDEPFYVSGSRIFTVDTGGQVLVQRAVRRELLSRMLARDFAANGAAFSEVHEEADTVLPAHVAGQWFVLGSDGTWSAQTNGLNPGNGVIAGYNAANKSVAGRYYGAEYSIQTTAGLAHLLVIAKQTSGGSWDGFSVSRDTLASRGTFRLGDDAGANINGPAFGSSFYGQQQAQTPSQFTFAILPNTAAAVVTIHHLRLFRQGF